MTSIDLPGDGDKVVLKMAGEHLRAFVAVGGSVVTYNVDLNFLSATGTLTQTGAAISTSDGNFCSRLLKTLPRINKNNWIFHFSSLFLLI
jgi:hypothetical protein